MIHVRSNHEPKIRPLFYQPCQAVIKGPPTSQPSPKSGSMTRVSERVTTNPRCPDICPLYLISNGPREQLSLSEMTIRPSIRPSKAISSLDIAFDLESSKSLTILPTHSPTQYPSQISFLLPSSPRYLLSILPHIPFRTYLSYPFLTSNNVVRARCLSPPPITFLIYLLRGSRSSL